MRRVEHVACMGKMKNAYIILVWKPEGRRQLGRHRGRWQNNIRMGLREIRFGSVDRTHLARKRDCWRALLNTVMNLEVP
jgi:hypothetical protein